MRRRSASATASARLAARAPYPGCDESLQPLVHLGHHLYVAHPVIICSRCGHYSVRRFAVLSRTCPVDEGKPLNPVSEFHLRRLRASKHPATGLAVVAPEALTARWWSALYQAAAPPAPVQEATRKRSLAELLDADAPVKVIIPAGATVGGVPLVRLAKKAADPYAVGPFGGAVAAPTRPPLTVLDTSSDSGSEVS